jgi:hypothetical protein
MSKPRIIQLVENVHMGLGHDGLKDLLKRAKIDVSKIEDAELVMCLNTKGDKLKVIGCKGMVLGYLKMPNGQKIMKEALQFIPRTFGSGGFDYDAACKSALDEKLNIRTRVVGPIKAAQAMREAGL